MKKTSSDVSQFSLDPLRLFPLLKPRISFPFLPPNCSSSLSVSYLSWSLSAVLSVLSLMYQYLWFPILIPSFRRLSLRVSQCEITVCEARKHVRATCRSLSIHVKTLTRRLLPGQRLFHLNPQLRAVLQIPDSPSFSNNAKMASSTILLLVILVIVDWSNAWERCASRSRLGRT